MIYTFYFILSLFIILRVRADVVHNEKDLYDKLSTKKTDIILTIDSDIIVTKQITLLTTLNQLTINGNSLSTSKLIFNYPLVFNENIKDIQIKDIHITGTLTFHNNKRITLDSVVLNGNIESDFDNSSNEYFKFIRVVYRPIDFTSFHHCINLQGNVEILNSKFYGGSSCEDRLLNYDGQSRYQIKIKNTYFSGEDQCSCLSITQSKDTKIEFTEFEKGLGKRDMDGG
ncbi:hypothetical protein PIROE2DRAFT_11150, partial [Piromyces sp. E2]